MRKKLNSPLYVFSLISIFFIFFLAPIDTDLGWHLRYGDYFWQTGRFLTHNSLTYYLSGYLWPNSYTLYQIIVSALYKLGGFSLLSFVYAFLGVITFAVFDATYPKLSKINYFFFLLAVFFGWNVFAYGLRAQVFSFTFIILLNYLINKHSFKAWIFIPFIFFLWANLHGAFVVGFVWLAVETVRLLIKKDYHNFVVFLAISALSFLATLINPYGFGVYLEVIRHAEVPMKTLIAEWLEPDFPHKLVIVFSTLILGFLILRREAKGKIHLLIPLIAFSYLGISARRNLGLTSISFILIIYELFHSQILPLETHKFTAKISSLLVIALIVYFGFINLPKTLSLNSDWNAFCQKGILPYPCRAVNFIKSNKIAGENVFTSYEWGGFLEWQLPSYKFFVDGRTPAWSTPEGKSPYTVYLEIIQARPGYQQTLDIYATDWLLVPAGTFLDIELKQNKNTLWHEIYRDEISVIYTNKTAK